MFLIKNKGLIGLGAFFAAWVVYFSYFWFNAFSTDEAGNLVVHHINIWGDWAAHFTMGSHMAYNELLPNNSPFLINVPFSYPFAANFLSAVLIRLGMPFIQAFVIPSFVCSLLIVAALLWWYKTFFSSTKSAILATSIFLFNGGLGFWQFIKDISQSETPWQTFLNPPQEYTHVTDWHIEWISVIQSMIIPQRAFALGFPLALIALTLLYRYFFTKTKRPSELLVSSVIVGLLPIVHTHSFLSLGIILPFWAVISLVEKKHRRIVSKSWLICGGVVLALALPLYFTFLQDNTSSGFISWAPGWYAREYGVNWLQFWLLNWGITPVLAVVGMVLMNKNHPQQLQLMLPFFLLFFVANLLSFQPYLWDNTKLFVWVSVGFSGLAGYALVAFWQNYRFVIARSLISFLFFLTIASGVIDAWRIIQLNLHSYVLYSKEDRDLAQWAKTETPADSVWLTSDAHNHWLYNLTGRQTLLTYRGWLWTHGYEYQEVETDALSLFDDPTQTELIEKYSLDYVVIGSWEKEQWGADEESFAAHHTLVKKTDQYSVYQIYNDSK